MTDKGTKEKGNLKKTLFVCESPCKSVAKKIGGGFRERNKVPGNLSLQQLTDYWSKIYLAPFLLTNWLSSLVTMF